MKEKFRGYFSTEKFQFQELSFEQKIRGQKIVNLSKAGLPKSSFGLVPLSLEILEKYLFRGRFEGFPGNSLVEVPNIKPEHESIQYYPTKAYIQSDFLSANPNYDPKKAAEMQAERFSQIHFVMSKLKVSIKNSNYFKAIEDVMFEYPQYAEPDIDKAWTFLMKDHSDVVLMSAIEEAKNYHGFILAISPKIKNSSDIDVSEEWDAETDIIISAKGLPDDSLLGLEAIGKEEKEYLNSLRRKIKN